MAHHRGPAAPPADAAERRSNQLAGCSAPAAASSTMISVPTTVRMISGRKRSSSSPDGTKTSGHRTLLLARTGRSLPDCNLEFDVHLGLLENRVRSTR